MAALPHSKLEEYLEGEFEAYTSNTVVNPSAIRKEIQKVKREGVAFDMEEHTEGICAVSTSFEDSFGCVYAISIPVPTARFKRHQKEFRAALMKCRDTIVGQLGEDKEA